MAAVRYRGMFRAAAVVYLFFGGAALWRWGFTDYEPALRPAGLALGALAAIVGMFLLKPARFAVALSAIGAALVSICAAVAAPMMRGPVILAMAAMAVVFAVYAALAARMLFTRSG